MDDFERYNAQEWDMAGGEQWETVGKGKKGKQKANVASMQDQPQGQRIQPQQQQQQPRAQPIQQRQQAQQPRQNQHKKKQGKGKAANNADLNSFHALFQDNAASPKPVAQPSAPARQAIVPPPHPLFVQQLEQQVPLENARPSPTGRTRQNQNQPAQQWHKFQQTSLAQQAPLPAPAFPPQFNAAHQHPVQVQNRNDPPIELLIDLEEPSPPAAAVAPPQHHGFTNVAIMPRMQQQPVSQGKPSRALQPLPDIDLQADAQALDAWRSRAQPTLFVRIPQELAIASNEYRDIARRYGTVISSDEDQDQAAATGSPQFGIWDTKAAANATRDAIVAWVSGAMANIESKRKHKFAKTPSQTPTLRRRADNAWERKALREQYRRCPPLNVAFGAIGTFHWPTNEYRPEDVLGMSFEALDPIRMDCNCYIIWAQDRSAFQLMGNADGVQMGLARMRWTYFQIIARQITPVRLYFLHGTAMLPAHVVLEAYHGPSSDGKPAAVCTEQTKSPRSVRVPGYPLRPAQTAPTGMIRDTILRTLRKLHYYRGHVELRFRFGKFVATQSRKTDSDTYTLEDYASMLTVSQFKGVVTQEIGDKIMEQSARSTLCTTPKLLTSGAGALELKDLPPTYTVTFTFTDPGGDFQLTKSWTGVEDSDRGTVELEPVSCKWIRLERGSSTPLQLIDINMQDLASGFAWNVDVHASYAIDEARLPTELRAFAAHVEIDKREARKGDMDKLFVTYRPLFNRLKAITQRLSYHYYLGDYTLELSKYQDRIYGLRPPLVLPPSEPNITYEPRWSLSVYQREWDKWFASNENLAVGERADWPDEADQWFPEDDAEDGGEEMGMKGFAQLIEKLDAVAKVMKESAVVEEEDLLLG